MYERCFWTLYIVCVKYRERIVDIIKKALMPGFRQAGVVSEPQVGNRVFHALLTPRDTVWLGI